MICSECERLFLPEPGECRCVGRTWHLAFWQLGVCYQCTVLNGLPKAKAQEILRRQVALVGPYLTRAGFHILCDQLRERISHQIIEKIKEIKKRGASDV